MAPFNGNEDVGHGNALFNRLRVSVRSDSQAGGFTSTVNMGSLVNYLLMSQDRLQGYGH